MKEERRYIAALQLYGENIIKAINVWGIRRIRYSAGVSDWSHK